MLMIRSTINILPLAFACSIICFRNKKNCRYDFENTYFFVKQLALTGIKLINKYKSIVNGLIKKNWDKTLI